MSTYLSGNPTFLPTVQPYEPNFQLYAGALQMKQTQYDQNRKKISDLYGSLLNSPLTRDSNIQARDEFFNTIDYEIKKLSSVDLSLQQNVDAASGLFTALYDNKNIVKDMMWTKNYNNEMDRAEGFRSCIDPDKCGGAFWDGGVQALQWKREEFRNSSDDQAMSAENVRYTPYVNVQEKATKMIKDLGWNMKVDSISPDGKWIVTTKNGEQLQGPLLAHFQKILGQDPAIGDYYKTKSYVDRKNWVASNTEAQGSAEAAEAAYIAEKNDLINKYMSQINGDAKYAKEQSQQKAEDAKKNLEEGKILRSQEVDDEIARLMGESDNYAHTEEQTGKAMSTVANAMSSENNLLKGEALDNALAMLGLNDDLSAAAQILAYQNYESTIKENGWAMAEQQHKWKMEEIAYADQLKEKKAEEAMTGDPLLNMMFPDDPDSDVELDEQAAYKMLMSDAAEDNKALKGSSQLVLDKTLKAAQTVANAKGSNSAQATDDAVQMVGEMFKQYKYNADYNGTENEKKEAQRFMSNWNSKSAVEKAYYAKTFDPSYLYKKFDGNSMNAVSKRTAVKMYDNNASNKVNRTYLRGLKGELGLAIDEAANYELQLKAWRETKEKVNKKVFSYLNTNGDPALRGLYDELVDAKTGKPRSADSFSFLVAKQKSITGANEESYKYFKESEQYVGERARASLKANEKWNYMSDAEKAKYGGDKEKFRKQVFMDEMPKGRDLVKFKTGTDRNGKDVYKYVDIDKFFTKDGLVRKEYSAYANKWTPGNMNSAFWNEYKGAKKLYAGDTAEQFEPSLGEEIWAYTRGSVFGAGAGGAKEIVNLYKEKGKQATENLNKRNTSVIQQYKEAFNQADVYSGTQVEGLYGAGSLTAKGLRTFVDYAAPQSQGVLAERSVLMDAFGGTRGKDVFFSFGGPGKNIPTANGANAEAFVRNLVLDAATSKATSEARPRWTGKWNAIAGGKAGWQSYTINMNDPTWMKQYVGTETAPGPYYEYFKDSMGKGANLGEVTIYLKDEAAQNMFHQQTKRTSLDRRLGWAGSSPIGYGKFDEFSNLELKKVNGGYTVNGQVAVAKDPITGAWEYEAISQDYIGSDVDPNLIEKYYTPILQDIGTKLQVPGISSNSFNN
jgi:hypothetical protein